jgi:hypothetical protein
MVCVHTKVEKSAPDMEAAKGQDYVYTHNSLMIA